MKQNYKKMIYAAMIFTALGIVFTTTLSETSGSLGIVLIAVGGLFMIIGLSAKKKEAEKDINS